MKLTIKIPDTVFRTAKTPEKIAEEIRQAAAIFWVARGDVAPEAVSEIIIAPSGTEKQGTLLADLTNRGNLNSPAEVRPGEGLRRPSLARGRLRPSGVVRSSAARPGVGDSSPPR